MPDTPLSTLCGPFFDSPATRRAVTSALTSPALQPNGHPWRRWVLVALGEVALIAVMIAMFWYQDWRYSLATPKPPNLKRPAMGTVLPLEAISATGSTSSSPRPILLHFFNPDCPCSRFNLDHVRKLHRQFGDRVDFVAVLEGTNAERLQQQFAQLNLPLRCIVDGDRSLAEVTGVYATPQAVILDRQQKLFYRGNYNTSRYCVAPQTEFARLALESLLQKSSEPSPHSIAATRAYGCSLPVCNQREVTR